MRDLDTSTEANRFMYIVRISSLKEKKDVSIAGVTEFCSSMRPETKTKRIQTVPRIFSIKS